MICSLYGEISEKDFSFGRHTAWCFLMSEYPKCHESLRLQIGTLQTVPVVVWTSIESFPNGRFQLAISELPGSEAHSSV